MKEGWVIKKLGEICVKTKNIKWLNDHQTHEYIDLSSVCRDSYSIIESNTIDKNNAPSRAKKVVTTGDIIFGTTRPTLKRVALIPKKFDNQICSTGFTVLRPNDELVTSKYIFYSLLQDAFMNRMESLQRGASYPAVTDSDVKGFEIPVPPLSEQNRIVATLDQAFEAIDQAIANTEKNLQNAQELFQSYLQQVFENKGEGWEELKLKDIGLTQTGNTPKTSEKENYGDYIPFIKPADVDYLGIGDIRYDNNGLSEIGFKKARHMKKNSILMVCIGATIGKVGYAERDVTSNQQINSLSLNKDFFPKFFYYAMTSKVFQNKVLSAGKGAQATLPIINKTKWENLTISFSKSKNDQQAFAEKLDDLRSQTKNLEARFIKKIEYFEEIKKSILQKAFQGELNIEKELA